MKMSEEKQKLRAATYNRVSPTKELKNELDIHKSLAEGIRMCRAAAEADGCEVVFEFSDQYISGKDNTAMQEFHNMLEAARKHEFDILFVKKVSRMGRNRKQTQAAIHELEADLNIPIVFVENKIDTRTPHGRMFIFVMTELAEIEREIIKENTSRGIKERITSGKGWGTPRKTIDVKKLRAARLAPVEERLTWKQCEVTFRASTRILIRELKDAGYWDHARRRVI